MKLFEMMCMNKAMNYESIFGRDGGIMRTCEITGEGIYYQMLQNLIEQGRVLFFLKNKNELSVDKKQKYGYNSSKRNLTT